MPCRGNTTIYDKNTEHAEALEKMDVRAFGCLLEDLLERLHLDFITHPSVTILTQLKEECMHNTISKRPYFIKLYETLKVISI